MAYSKGQCAAIQYQDLHLCLKREHSDLTGFLETWVNVSRDGVDLGHAIFADIEGSLYPLSTMLDDSIQKRGVATAMYVFAEKETGMQIVPSEDQKAPGKALWAQKVRPFGRSVRAKIDSLYVAIPVCYFFKLVPQCLSGAVRLHV